MSTTRLLHILILEDNPVDADVLSHTLTQEGFEYESVRVETEADFISQLSAYPDLILADYSLPQFNALQALQVLKDRGPDIPFIIVTGTVSEETAVACIKQGAADYLLKDRLTRLGQAVVKALADKDLREKQRNAAKELAASEIRYRRLFEAAQDGILILDVSTGQVLDVNPFLLDLLGYSPEDLLGKELWQIGLFHDIVSSKVAFGEFQDKGYIRYENLPLETRDGRRIEVEFVSNVYLVNDAKVIQCNIRDITERKIAERKTAELAAIVESSQDGIFGQTLDGIIISWNKGAEDIYGYSESEMIGKSVSILVPPDCAEEVPEILEKIRLGKHIERFEALRQTKSGQVIPVSLTISPVLDTKGRIIAASTICRDITERKRTEQLLVTERNLLRTLIDNLPDRVYAKDADGRFTLKNEVDARQMGVVSTGEVIGKTDFDYYPVELAEAYQADDRAVIQSGQALINREEPFITADGNRGWMLTSKVPLRDAHGHVTGLVGIGRDISERKVAEEQLRKLNRTLTVLSEVNRAIVGIRPTAALFEEICRIAVDSGGFRMAWVGLFDTETTKVNPVGSAGATDDYLERLAIQLNDEVHRGGPTGSALSTSQHVIVNDVEHDSRMAPWREDALRLGYRASAAFPLDVAGEVRATLNLYADASDFFDEAEIGLLDEMTADISFAMEFAEQEAQRKAAETALQLHMQAVEEMRLFLQTTLDAFPANTVVLDPDGTIINVNASWIRFAVENSAPSPMYYLGTNYLTVCETAVGSMSEQAASAADGIQAVIKGRQNAFYLEYPCSSPSEKRWFAMRVTPFPEPVPRRVVIAHINITERKQAVDKLQEAHDTLEERVGERTLELTRARERVEAILSNSPDAILLLSSDLRLQQTNSAFNQMFACEADDYFDKSVLALVQAEESDLLLETVQAVTAEAQRKHLDVHAHRKDATVFNASIHIGTVKDAGIICTIRDITEQKELERELRYQASLQENVTDAVVATDLEFRIQSWNSAAVRIYGWTAEEVIGRSASDILQTEYPSPEIQERVLHTFQEQGYWSNEVMQHHKDGHAIPILSSTVLFKDESGQAFGIVAVNHDFTERKKAELALQQAFDKEKELGEIKSRLISMASHDFRTPLAVILSSASLLETGNDRMTAEQRGKHYGKIQTAVNRMTLLLEDVLTYSKADAGQVAVEPEYIEIEAFCTELSEEIDAFANHTHILRFTLQGHEHAVFLDRKLLRQILLNLLSNAVKYSASESTVYLDWAISARQVTFTVKDEGGGIPDKDLPHLFEAFHRGSNTGAVPGTGLGLAIVKKDVDLLGGSIDVNSEIGIGTTFTVTIPVAVETER